MYWGDPLDRSGRPGGGGVEGRHLSGVEGWHLSGVLVVLLPGRCAEGFVARGIVCLTWGGGDGYRSCSWSGETGGVRVVCVLEEMTDQDGPDCESPDFRF